MSRMWKFIILLAASILLLAACGKSVEEQSKEGLQAAEAAFYADNKEHTEEVDGVKFYKPIGFEVSDSSDEQNIVLYKGKQPFILFINPNEAKNSELFYELLVADENVKVSAEERFTDEDTFGFAAVSETEDGTVELIASVGGAKITTLTNKKNIASNLETMMQIVRSIN